MNASLTRPSMAVIEELSAITYVYRLSIINRSSQTTTKKRTQPHPHPQTHPASVQCYTHVVVIIIVVVDGHRQRRRRTTTTTAPLMPVFCAPKRAQRSSTVTGRWWIAQSMGTCTQVYQRQRRLLSRSESIRWKKIEIHRRLHAAAAAVRRHSC